jgi:hypothetical protein
MWPWEGINPIVTKMPTLTGSGMQGTAKMDDETREVLLPPRASEKGHQKNRFNQ